MKDSLVIPKLNSQLKISFVLPTKNEMDSIKSVISDIQKLGKEFNWNHRIILSDDSTDETKRIALSMGATVIDGKNLGLGAAVILGLREALSDAPEWIFTLDTDGQVEISEIPKFLETAINQSADLVISSRFLGKENFQYQYPYLNWVGNRILVAILFLATGRFFTDSHGGIRLIKAELAQNFSLMGKHTYVQETLIASHRRGAKIIELPSKWKIRKFGKSRVLNSIFRYVYRTLPALSYYLYLHFGFAALSLYALFQFQRSGYQSMPFAIVGLCLMILALKIFSLRFFRLTVK
jgi:glycosyltransferase involved in cell wall biosynthesis